MSFIIYDGANPATIASGTTVTLQMTRPSGISYSRAGSISGNVVSMSTTLDMTRESGDIEAELRFVRSSEDVGTCNFTLSVEPAAKKDDAIDADTEALQLIADQVRADTNQSTTNAKNAKTAESNAKSYATSAKTNADIATAAAKSAGKSATEAAESEQTALDAATRAEAAADRLIPDPTLTLEGMPAEAKATGEAISTLEQSIYELGLTSEARFALLDFLSILAVEDQTAEEKFATLEEALNTSYTHRRPELPDTYEQVEFIKGEGSQYIVTDVVSQIPFEVRAKIALARAGNVFVGASLLSSASGFAGSRFFALAYMNDATLGGTRIANRFGAVSSWTGDSNFAPAINEPYKVISGIALSENNQAKVYVTCGESSVEKTQIIPTVLDQPVNILRTTADNYVGSGTIYEMKMYSGNVIIFDGIPCYRKADGKGGLYDAVNNKFYPSEGSKDFIVGNIVR